MPICTTCTTFTPYLYTLYHSAHNLRLEQCSKCHSFADPYVEFDSLALLLDLILLKRGVYRHLLYNRGTEPRKSIAEDTIDATSVISSGRKERKRWLHVAQLGAVLVVLDAFIRWCHLHPGIPASTSPWTKETMRGMLRVFLGCCAETVTFHLGIMVSCYMMLRLTSWVQSWKNWGREARPPISDIKREFKFSLIPLTLFYSSLTKLFLLSLLTIWRPLPKHRPDAEFPSSTIDSWGAAFLYDNSFIQSFLTSLRTLEDEQIDREWIIRNILGGMSAGFGLRVVLDMHPIFTSIIILVAWKMKTIVTGTIGGWVGGDEAFGEAWRAYSVP